MQSVLAGALFYLTILFPHATLVYRDFCFIVWQIPFCLGLCDLPGCVWNRKSLIFSADLAPECTLKTAIEFSWNNNTGQTFKTYLLIQNIFHQFEVSDIFFPWNKVDNGSQCNKLTVVLSYIKSCLCGFNFRMTLQHCLMKNVEAL